MTEGNGVNLSMPVAPANMYGGYGGGDMFGNSAWWIIILLLFGGWNRGGNYGGGGGGYNYGEVQRGFDQTAVMNGIGGIKEAISLGFQNVETAAAARQMAGMQQAFGIQSAVTDCCCKTQSGLADLKYTIANEACATRAADAANKQQIMDKLCQLEMDGMRQNYEAQIRAMQDKLDAERANNQALRFAASQGAQTAALKADNEAQTVALEQYLAPTARPAYIVPNPNCCPNQWGYGCGSAA